MKNSDLERLIEAVKRGKVACIWPYCWYLDLTCGEGAGTHREYWRKIREVLGEKVWNELIGMCKVLSGSEVIDKGEWSWECVLINKPILVDVSPEWDSERGCMIMQKLILTELEEMRRR